MITRLRMAQVEMTARPSATAAAGSQMTQDAPVKTRTTEAIRYAPPPGCRAGSAGLPAPVLTKDQ